MYSVNFTKEKTKFCLSLHYNEVISYLFVNGTEIIKFKAKDTEITPYKLSLGSISKDAIPVSNILDIRKYLMKRNAIL